MSLEILWWFWGDYLEVFVRNTTDSTGVDNDQMTLTVFGEF